MRRGVPSLPIDARDPQSRSTSQLDDADLILLAAASGDGRVAGGGGARRRGRAAGPWRGRPCCAGRCWSGCGPATSRSRCGRRRAGRVSSSSSGLPLLSGASALVKRPASIRWKRWRARRASAALAAPDQRRWCARTVSITSMSRSIGWLKVIWLMRAVISRAVVGTPGLSMRVELDDQRVADRALAPQRHEVGVGREAAVPIGVPVDGDGVMDGGQAGRGQHALHASSRGGGTGAGRPVATSVAAISSSGPGLVRSRAKSMCASSSLRKGSKPSGLKS